MVCLLKLAALIAVVEARGASACNSDLDCSLNGVCDKSSGSCMCDKPWVDGKSEKCAILDILPHPDNYIPAYGGSGTDTTWQKGYNTTSWGGNIIKGGDGLWHMFVSEMADGVGLSGWGHISQIAHATAKDPMDVFEKADLAIGKEAHNASPLKQKNGSKWYIFHIGTGQGEALQGTGFLHSSDSPAGPWKALPSISCNNPAPMFHNNGTLYCGCNSGGFKVYGTDDPTKPHNWKFVTMLKFPESWGGGTSPYVRNEDPYMWMDWRGSWHLLAHRYDYRDGYPPNPNQTEPVLVSGHGYSEDGVNWHFNDEPPYGAEITFTNGTVQKFSTWERPHLVFNDEQVPTHLVNGVSAYWDEASQHCQGPCDGCAARPGSQHSCVVCKTSEGVDYTYTLVSKLNV